MPRPATSMAVPSSIPRPSRAVNPEHQEACMDITRREFAAALTGVAGAASLRRDALRTPATDPCHLPAPIQALTPKINGIVPITDEERRARIAKAQGLMVAQ